MVSRWPLTWARLIFTEFTFVNGREFHTLGVVITIQTLSTTCVTGNSQQEHTWATVTFRCKTSIRLHVRYIYNYVAMNLLWLYTMLFQHPNLTNNRHFEVHDMALGQSTVILIEDEILMWSQLDYYHSDWLTNVVHVVGVDAFSSTSVLFRSRAMSIFRDDI